MAFAFRDPLEFYACSYLPAFSEGPINKHQRQAIERFRALVRGECVPDDAAAAFRFAFGTDEPIHKVLAILQIPPDPIRCFLRPIDGRRYGRRQKSHTWAEYEDQRLIAGIHKYGLDNWHDVAEFIGNGRTRSQCAQRWNRSLNPHIFKGPWTAKEEERLIMLVKKYGEKAWKMIAGEFGNRSDVQCRYHYQQIQRKVGARLGKVPVVVKELQGQGRETEGIKLVGETPDMFDEIASEFAVWRDRETWKEVFGRESSFVAPEGSAGSFPMED
jgi:hypothetical protein